MFLIQDADIQLITKILAEIPNVRSWQARRKALEFYKAK